MGDDLPGELLLARARRRQRLHHALPGGLQAFLARRDLGQRGVGALELLHAR